MWAAAAGGASPELRYTPKSDAAAAGCNSFVFDTVWGPQATNEDVYKQLVAPMVASTMLQGLNSVVFAYGEQSNHAKCMQPLPSAFWPQHAQTSCNHQHFSDHRCMAAGQTGAGKTYTQASMMRQAAASIFQFIQSQPGREYLLRMVSAVELVHVGHARLPGPM